MNVSDIENLIDLYGDIVYGFCRRSAVNNAKNVKFKSYWE